MTGFLGSGKTTLVKYLLGSMDQGLRIGIVQNEYAAASIDTAELREVDRKFDVLEVNNGSVFCVCLLGSFIDSLAEFTDRYKPGMLIIEASGLSDPIAIAEILQHPALADRIYLAGVWCIVDAANFQRVSKMNTRIERQIRIADRILLNKTDLINESPEALRQSLEILNPEAAVFPTTFCRIPESLILEPVQDPLAFKKETDHRKLSPGGPAEINTLVLRTSRPIERKGLDLFIREVEGKLIRLKGFVLLTDQKIIGIQGEYGRTRTREVEYYHGITELVGLGWDISAAHFGRRFHDIRKSSQAHVN